MVLHAISDSLFGFLINDWNLTRPIQNLSTMRKTCFDFYSMMLKCPGPDAAKLDCQITMTDYCYKVFLMKCQCLISTKHNSGTQKKFYF